MRDQFCQLKVSLARQVTGQVLFALEIPWHACHRGGSHLPGGIFIGNLSVLVLSDADGNGTDDVLSRCWLNL